VGLEERQLVGVPDALLQAAQAARPGVLRIGVVHGSGPGYFKLQRGNRGSGRSSSSSGTGDGSSSDGGGSGSEEPRPQRVLVVAFGSAPGLPNWGGVLRQVQAAMEKSGYNG